MGERETGGWRLDLSVLLGAWAFFVLVHPPPGILWFDYSWITYNLLPLPFTPWGLNEAIRWQATVHSSWLVRPARAVQWWLAVKLLGCGPLTYYVANVLVLGAAVWMVTRVAGLLTGSRVRGLVVGACLAVSYATVYSILFFGFALTATLAFGGLLAYFRSETSTGVRQRRLQAAALLLLGVAGLSHETFLAFTLIPLAHSGVVRRDRAAMRRALIFVAILPLYAVWRSLLVSVYGGAPATLGGTLLKFRDAPAVVENTGRVLFTVLTGGLPLDPLRVLPNFPEFVRLRELILSRAGLLTLALVGAPALGLGAAALDAGREDVAIRRRMGFFLIWLLLGSVPLMLPVGTPEAFHLTGALPALFLLWTEGLVLRPGRRTAVFSAAWGLLLLWMGIHGAARWVLFHRDVPAMAHSVQELHRVLARAEADGVQAGVFFFPAQIGGHYGMMPTVPALYPSDGARGRICLRGDEPRGCLVERTWVWSTLHPWPPLPHACRAPDGIRVGPLSPAIEREIEGSRRMLAHPSAGITTDARLVSLCPITGVESVVLGGATYWLYRVHVSPGSRWYRFDLEAGPALLPIADCGVVNR